MTLAHTTRGDGARAVILLHGFLGSGRNLGSLARAWSERDGAIRLVLPDLTGHGASPSLLPGADLFTLARDVLELARALALTPPLELAGHSLGGRVALAACTLEPGAIGRVTLLDASPSPHAEQAGDELAQVVGAMLAAPAEAAARGEIDRALIAAGLSRSLSSWLAMNLIEEGGRYRWRVDRRALAELLQRTRAVDLWPVVEQSSVEVSLIRGARSTFVSAETAERMARAGRRVVTIEGAGHFLHVDRPSAVLEALIAGGRLAARP